MFFVFFAALSFFGFVFFCNGSVALLGNFRTEIFTQKRKDVSSRRVPIAKIIDDAIVINVPAKALLADDRKGSLVRWLANLNIKRNLTSVFVNKYIS